MFQFIVLLVMLQSTGRFLLGLSSCFLGSVLQHLQGFADNRDHSMTVITAYHARKYEAHMLHNTRHKRTTKQSITEQRALVLQSYVILRMAIGNSTVMKLLTQLVQDTVAAALDLYTLYSFMLIWMTLHMANCLTWQHCHEHQLKFAMKQ